jgi:hypothetical protein
MMRTISTIALAATGALLLSACTEGKVSLSNTLVSCENNKVNLPGGGYVWTWVDNAKKASITPLTGYTAAESFTPEPSDLVFPDGSKGNKSCHVTGIAPAKPLYSDLTSDLPMTDPCGETPVYPTTGIGFSLQDKNAPYNVCTKAGITFWAKAGAATTTTIKVTFPTAETDVPNTTPTNPIQPPAGQEDKFTKSCKCGTELDLVADPTALKTCFSNVYEDVPITTTWAQYTVYFGNTLTPGFMGTVPFNGTQALKVQFEAIVPETGLPDNAFDYWIDEVAFIDNVDASGAAVDWCTAGTGAPKSPTVVDTSTATGTAIAP